MRNRGLLLLALGGLLVSAPALAQGVGETPAQPAPPDKQAHVGEGKVNRVDVNAGKVNLTHEPIPSLGWPAMTMDFVVSNREQLAALRPGQRVQFEMRPLGNQYVIDTIRPVKRSPG
jgi:Cu/Ag efflux protein CusF